MRRVVLVADVSLRRRLELRARAWPWRLLALADTRLSYADRLAVADAFVRMRACCVPPGLARNVLAMNPTADALLEPPWIGRWHMFAKLVTLNVADVEWRHGRNRNKASHFHQNTMVQVAARSVCSEAQVLHRSTRELRSLLNSRQIVPLQDGHAFVYKWGQGGGCRSLVFVGSSFERSLSSNVQNVICPSLAL